jgi:hypothetical protein
MHLLRHCFCAVICATLLSTPVSAQSLPDCLPAETDLPDNEFAYLATAADVQRNVAQQLLDQKDHAAAAICAQQATQTSHELADLAILDHVISLTFESEIQRQAGDLPRATDFLKTAAKLLETTLLTQDVEAGQIGLARVAPTYAKTLRQIGSPAAPAAYAKVVLWAECGHIYADEIDTYIAALRDLGQTPTADITDEMCALPINFDAFQ